MSSEPKSTFFLGLRRMGFPIRLMIASIIGIGATAAILGRYQFDFFAALMVLLSVLLIIVLAYVVYPLLKSMKVSNGIIIAWYVFLLMPGLIYLLHPWIDALRIEYFPEMNILTLDFDAMRVYLMILGLFILPISLGIEQLLSAQSDVQTLEKESELTDLDFRIRPHFLFNSLNSIASLITIDPIRAEDGLIDLADMFRIVLTDKRKLVPFSAEYEMASNYMSLEKMRLGDRLVDKWEVDQIDKTTLVPILTLQPLIENAIYHGIETRLKGGTVLIKARENRDYLYISIINPVSEAGKPARKGNQIAQKNLTNRFAHLYQGKGAISYIETDTLYTVTLKVPRRISYAD